MSQDREGLWTVHNRQGDVFSEDRRVEHDAKLEGVYELGGDAADAQVWKADLGEDGFEDDIGDGEADKEVTARRRQTEGEREREASERVNE